jgi:hypothetical protein
MLEFDLFVEDRFKEFAKEETEKNNTKNTSKDVLRREIKKYQMRIYRYLKYKENPEYMKLIQFILFKNSLSYILGVLLLFGI